MKYLERLRALMGRGHTKKFVFNTGWLMTERVVHLVLSMLITMLTSRYLGKENYGLINNGMAYIMVFTVISKLGIDGILVNELVRGEVPAGRLLGTTVVLRAISGVLSIALTMLAVIVINPDHPTLLMITAIQSLALVFISIDTISYWYQAHLKSKYSAIAKCISYIAVCLLRVVLVWTKADVYMFAIAAALDSGVIAVFLWWFYRRDGGEKLSFSWDVGKDLMKKGLPFIITGLLITVYNQMDKIMVGAIIGDAEVAIYTAGYTICGMWLFVPHALVESARPLITKAKLENEQLYLTRFRQLLCAIIWISIAAGVFITLLAGPIIDILYSAEFAAAVPVLIVIVWSRLFSLAGVVRSVWLLCEQRTRYTVPFAAIGALTNLILNSVMIPTMGALGAAIATLITEVLSVLFAVLLFKDTRAYFGLFWQAFAFQGIGRLGKSKRPGVGQ